MIIAKPALESSALDVSSTGRYPHRVEGVAAELVIPLDGEHEVQLHAPVDGDLLVVVRPVRLAAELRVPHPQRPVTTQERSPGRLPRKMAVSVQELCLLICIRPYGRRTCS